MIKLLVVGLAGIGIMLSQSTSAKTLKAAIIQLEPYGFLSVEEKHTGIHYDLLKQLSEKTGYALETELAPFARVLVMIEFGDADLTLMYRNEKIGKSAIIVGPFNLSRTVVFGRPGRKLNSLEDLHGLVVANLRGANYNDGFMADEAIRKYWTNDYEQNLGMFLQHRVDAVVGPEDGILYAMKKMGLKPNIFGTPLILSSRKPYLFYSKKTADDRTVSVLRQALAEMWESGDIRAIYSSYLN